MNPTEYQKRLFCMEFVNQNPSFRHYAVTLGLYRKFYTLAELQQYSARIMGKRLHLRIGTLSTAHIYHNSIHPN
ncbi:hypothetical protein [Spirosoma harenae]